MPEDVRKEMMKIDEIRELYVMCQDPEIREAVAEILERKLGES